MIYYKAKYIEIIEKNKGDFLLINEVTLDQFLIKSHLKDLIVSFKDGADIEKCDPTLKEELSFLIEKKILIEESVFGFETYNCQIPNDTYFRLKPLKQEEEKFNKIVFLGIPYGKGNPSDFRTSNFPSTFRTFSKSISLIDRQHFLSYPIGSVLNEKCIQNLQNLIDSDRIRDMGDMFIHQFESNAKAYNKIEEIYGKVFKSGLKPIGLGGDHSITYPILKSLSENLEEFNVVHFDAHTDIYEGKFLDINEEFDFFHHGNFVTKSLALKSLKNYYMFGLRGKPTGDVNKKISFFDIGKVKKILINPEEMNMKISGKTYVTFDIDVFDPVYAPGTATPVSYGLDPFEVINLLEICLKDADIVGIDFVEVNPSRDDKNKNTMIVALNTVINLLTYYK
jgi:agmatinase